ncbi:hypothetical protein HK101_008649 [Irineochytrium annulatum]|nr:hypothetical protein HK101_008649 [Irineochytrium annulatum]
MMFMMMTVTMLIHTTLSMSQFVEFIHISHRKLSIQDPFLHLDLLMQMSQPSQVTPYCNDLQALVMVQVYMHIGDDVMMRLMLELHQANGKITDMVIIDHHNGASYILIGLLYGRLK